MNTVTNFKAYAYKKSLEDRTNLKYRDYARIPYNNPGLLKFRLALDLQFYEHPLRDDAPQEDINFVRKTYETLVDLWNCLNIEEGEQE